MVVFKDAYDRGFHETTHDELILPTLANIARYQQLHCLQSTTTLGSKDVKVTYAMECWCSRQMYCCWCLSLW